MRWYDTDSMDNRDPAMIHRLADTIEPLLSRWFRPVIHGIERIPPGAALYVGNHNAGMLTPDSYVFGIAALRGHGVEAVPYGLMHQVPIRWPIVHQLFVPMGAVRAHPDNGLRALREGHKVLVYPGGDIDAMRSWSDRHRVIFGPRRGYIRLALRAGAPIVPVVTAGAHETYLVLSDGRRIAERLGTDRLFRVKRWPVALSLPWGLTIGPTPPHFPWPSRMVMEVLPPVRFDRAGEEAAADASYVEQCHELVHGAMQDALIRLAAERELLNAAERKNRRTR